MNAEATDATAGALPNAGNLLEDPDVSLAVEGKLPAEILMRYQTVLDCLLCELFPEFGKICATYYKKPSAERLYKNVVPPEQQVLHDASLCSLLHLVKELKDSPADWDVIKRLTQVRIAKE